MEEIYNEQPNDVDSSAKADSNAAAAERRQTWGRWFETDEALRWVYLIFGLFAIFLLMILLQYSTSAICCGDWDGYYHIRWSALLWENFKHGHWIPDFTWLPLTVLNQNDYADHHFLFHLLQIPFLWFFEPVTAAKLAAIFYGSLSIFSVYWLMFRYKIEYLLVWLAALLVCANSFYYRINMAKAPPLTIIYTVAGIYLLFERKYALLLPLMFVFVWTYSLFPILFVAAVFWTIIIVWNERVFEWRPTVYTMGGMILGNIINPYFPQNLYLFSEHYFEKFKIGSDFAVSVGGEWYPFSGMELLMNLPVALLAMIIGYILFYPKNGKLPEKSAFFLMFATVLLAAQFRSKRYAEYFPPFAILFAAFSWREFIKPSFQLPEDFRADIAPYLDRVKGLETQQVAGAFKKFAPWLLGLLLVVWMIYNLTGVNTTNLVDEKWKNTPGLRAIFGVNESGLISDIRGNEPNDKYRRATDWANENIPAGERIFNCNWDDFPKLFFYDQKHNYVYGLDPNYLYTKNPDDYKLVMDLTAGKIDDPAPQIREKLGARFIFSDAKENDDFVAKCLSSGWCEMAYEDDEARILKIRDAKGEPPSVNSDDEKPPTPEELKQLEEEEKQAAANDKNARNNGNDEEDEDNEN